MRARLVAFLCAVALSLMPAATSRADDIRECDGPFDPNCCSLMETLKGCRN